jgi:hypothetical protein
MTKKISFPGLLIFGCYILFGCNAFMHGYTEDKALNKYLLVTGDKDNFGDRRIKYNKGFHNHSALYNFLTCDCKSHPNFIYEYKTTTKCRGIKLYYVTIDSVFTFEEPRKGNHGSILKDSRKMDESERQVYQNLTGKK